MGSYQIHISCYSKERTRKMESQATVGKSGQLHTSQEPSNIRETAKTEHQKTSITTLTYFGFYSVPFHAAPWLQPPVPCSSWIPLSVLCACTAQSAWSKHSHSLLCLLQVHAHQPQVSPASLAITSFLKPTHPPSLLRDFLNLFPSVKPQHFSCISSGHDLVSLENGSNCKNFW